MDNELNLDLDNIEKETQEKLQVKDRFAKLSEKMTLTAKEKEESDAKAKAEGERATQAEKERDFFKNFNALSTKYPNAPQFQDKIWDKVKLGYTEEDATVAVLNTEGKLTYESPKPDNPAGGSASNIIADTGNKTLAEMTLAEKESALIELEKKGDLYLS